MVSELGWLPLATSVDERSRERPCLTMVEWQDRSAGVPKTVTLGRNTQFAGITKTIAATGIAPQLADRNRETMRALLGPSLVGQAAGFAKLTSISKSLELGVSSQLGELSKTVARASMAAHFADRNRETMRALFDPSLVDQAAQRADQYRQMTRDVSEDRPSAPNSPLPSDSSDFLYLSWLVAFSTFLLLLSFRLFEANRLGIYLPAEDRFDLLSDSAQIVGWSFVAKKLADEFIRRIR
jgi:hypothetical protein